MKIFIVAILSLTTFGCAQTHYRNTLQKDPYSEENACNYAQVNDAQEQCTSYATNKKELSPAREKGPGYDLFFLEFDDQGWLNGTHNEEKIESPDSTDLLMAELTKISNKNTAEKNDTVITIFLHGWRHNASSKDENVKDFRRYLRNLASHYKDSRKKIIGIYPSWRGASYKIGVNYLDAIELITFWARKNTADKIASGQIRELLARVDVIRKESQKSSNVGKVYQITIGHSFGGLIVLQALNSWHTFNLASNLQRSTINHQHEIDSSGVGDIVFILNPAIEGTRYESIHRLSNKLTKVNKVPRFPQVITITSKADLATRRSFPIARFFYRIFERDPGEQHEANLYTYGHTDRFESHVLKLKSQTLDINKKTDSHSVPECAFTEEETRRALHRLAAIREDALAANSSSVLSNNKVEIAGNMTIENSEEIFFIDAKTSKPIIQSPADHWVIRTNEEIIEDHNDIFNANVYCFLRQFSAKIFDPLQDGEREVK